MLIDKYILCRLLQRVQFEYYIITSFFLERTSTKINATRPYGLLLIGVSHPMGIILCTHKAFFSGEYYHFISHNGTPYSNKKK